MSNKTEEEMNNDDIQASAWVSAFIIIIACVVLAFFAGHSVGYKKSKKNCEVPDLDTFSIVRSCKLITIRDEMEDLMSRRINVYSESKSEKEKVKIDKELDDLEVLLEFPDNKRVRIESFFPAVSSPGDSVRGKFLSRVLVRDKAGEILVDVNF